jgi:hypothetical protein
VPKSSRSVTNTTPPGASSGLRPARSGEALPAASCRRGGRGDDVRLAQISDRRANWSKPGHPAPSCLAGDVAGPEWPAAEGQARASRTGCGGGRHNLALHVSSASVCHLCFQSRRAVGGGPALGRMAAFSAHPPLVCWVHRSRRGLDVGWLVDTRSHRRGGQAGRGRQMARPDFGRAASWPTPDVQVRGQVVGSFRSRGRRSRRAAPARAQQEPLAGGSRTSSTAGCLAAWRIERAQRLVSSPNHSMRTGSVAGGERRSARR